MELNTVRELLAQGQTGKALEALLALIRQDARYKNNLTQTLEVLQAGYERTRQQEQKGILSFQEAQREYSKAADAALSILNDVEAGRVPAAVRRSRMFMLLGAGVLVLAGVLVWLNLRKTEPECPTFSPEAHLRILVIPFDTLGSKKTDVEVLIQQGIQDLTKKAKINADVKLIGRGDKDLSSLQVAESRATTCKADLVVFGKYKAYSGDSVRVNLGYKFLNGERQSADFPFETFRDITAVTVPRDFQDALFSMCAVLAMRDKNWEFAKRWMDKIKEKDSREIAMAEWMAEKLKK